MVIEQLLYPFIATVAGGIVVVTLHEVFEIIKKIPNPYANVN